MGVHAYNPKSHAPFWRVALQQGNIISFAWCKDLSSCAAAFLKAKKGGLAECKRIPAEAVAR